MSVFLVFFYFFSIVYFPEKVIVAKFFSYPGHWKVENWVLSIFFHGSPSHLFHNVVFLFFLGRVVEEKTGASRWALFYFMAGFISVVFDSIIRGYILLDKTPVVGASGAISGLAAVAALLSPFTFKVKQITIPFPVFAVAWLMVYSDFIGLFADDRVAHWAHLAGFFSVFVTAYLVSPKERENLHRGFLINLVFFTLTMIVFYLWSNR